MKNDKVFKNKFVEKLSTTYGFEPLHARLIYDLMVESFVEAWDGGTDLYIPRIGEQSEAVSATNMAGGSGGSDTVLSVSSQRVNINTASQKELEELWGIGPVTAQNIIEQRPYSSVEELLQKGI